MLAVAAIVSLLVGIPFSDGFRKDDAMVADLYVLAGGPYTTSLDVTPVVGRLSSQALAHALLHRLIAGCSSRQGIRKGETTLAALATKVRNNTAGLIAKDGKIRIAAHCDRPL
jgi:hypothetical protein